MGRKEFIPSKHSKVCSDHFVPSDFQQNVGGTYKLKLNANAVPSIFPSYPKQSVSQLKIPESGKLK